MATVRANPKDCVIRKRVTQVEFGLYTDEDVRARSVCEVTSRQAFDTSLGAPLPGGLYDPRMGPGSSHTAHPCPICACRYSSCPGHFGHIELCVPVYHPLLFPQLLKLLSMKCFHCHQLRAPPRICSIFRVKFALLEQGRLNDFMELDTLLAQAIQKYQDNQDSDRKFPTDKVSKERLMAAAMDGVLKEMQEFLTLQKQSKKRKKPPAPSSFQRSLQRDLIKQCIADLKGQKNCSRCGAFSPKIRHDNSNKLFQSPLTQTASRLNDAEGFILKSALQTLENRRAKDPPGSKPDETFDNQEEEDDDDDDDDDDADADDDNTVQGDEEMQDKAEADDDANDDDDDDDDSSSSSDDDDEEQEKEENLSRDKFMHASEVHAQVQLTWQTDAQLLRYIFGADMINFFMQVVPVIPNRFRPPMILGGMTVEHGQNQYLSKIIQYNEAIRNYLVLSNDNDKEGGDGATATTLAATSTMTNKNTLSNESMAYSTWINLQVVVNCFMDSTKDPSSSSAANVAPGIRQLLEKKEGIFRKHMMGKRVDYACRSVISPDPYIGTNEIGIPLHFAKTLTYPTHVSDFNIVEMQRLVEGGTDIYPGAKWVEFPGGRRVDLAKMQAQRRKALAARLLTHVKHGSGRPAMVGRQLKDGDFMLVNRQPTLHKPGIMAHQVRVLHSPTQKTLRMHYANCNTYNADFDGDEMNCHFPQEEVATAEAIYIANANLQYIVPTDGSPLRGLIQDHVVSGVQLTKRDTFLELWEYQQLLFASLASLPGLEVIADDMDIELMPPAIIKPKPMWTGKQVISTLLWHLRKGNDRDNDRDEAKDGKGKIRGGLSLERKAKTPAWAFGEANEEHEVIVRDGELLRGVLDKAAFGATDFSLVHGVFEAYGPAKGGLFLNALGRLFTAYLQYFAGHSCRMEDLVLTDKADRERRRLVERAYNVGARACKAWADSDGGKIPIEDVTKHLDADKPLKPVEVAAASAQVGMLLSGPSGKENFARLDAYMQSQLNPLASEIVKECLPKGLAVPFPVNTFGVMTTTGAKGSIVNQSQVSCALGQQALEGRRVPRLNSGKTLPSFAPYDVNPRADGFVMDRFLTGVRPQEYYFHCMAGREGLVDTAVKTSRSGYLQRCLVKHLEELKVSYDFTVRNGEGGVVQFLYGEDALDPTKASYLDCSKGSFEFFARNNVSLKSQQVPLPDSRIDIVAKDCARNELFNSSDSAQSKELSVGDFVKARRLLEGTEWARGAICQGWHDAFITKVHSNGYLFDIKYAKDNHIHQRVPLAVDLGPGGSRETSSASSICTVIMPAVPDPLLSAPERGYRLGQSGAVVSERVAAAASKALESQELAEVMKINKLDISDVANLVAAKYGSALCHPGEAVGSIAAQSVGEPSTQMTLNTFHLAGSGANVTLGIPRLREIIMTASKNLKTPTMSVPLREAVSEKQAIRLTRQYSKLTMMELISGDRGVSVRETLEVSASGNWKRSYYVSIRLHPAERIKEAFGLSLNDIAAKVAEKLVPRISYLMKLELRRSTKGDSFTSTKVDGGTSTFAASAEKSDLPSNDHHDDLGDVSDDDKDDEMGEEDGVEATKYNRSEEKQSNYDAKEEDEDADADEDSDSSDDDDIDDEDAKQQDEGMSPSKDIPMMMQDSDSSEVKVDWAHNTILLPSLQVDPSVRPLLMIGLVEAAAETVVVKSKKAIEQAYINEEDNDRGRCFQTAGVNFAEIWKMDDSIVDHNLLMSNDIWAIRCAYGVEAARTSIVDQIRSVFGAYGIEVDPRHLSLIADYMTNGGDYKAMNRRGMEDTSSTFLQMSFETTAHFMTQAACHGFSDKLNSPSGNIVLGRPMEHGTGAFDLLAK